MTSYALVVNWIGTEDDGLHVAPISEVTYLISGGMKVPKSAVYALRPAYIVEGERGDWTDEPVTLTMRRGLEATPLRPAHIVEEATPHPSDHPDRRVLIRSDFSAPGPEPIRNIAWESDGSAVCIDGVWYHRSDEAVVRGLCDSPDLPHFSSQVAALRSALIEVMQVSAEATGYDPFFGTPPSPPDPGDSE